jgi:hypothetical protein
VVDWMQWKNEQSLKPPKLKEPRIFSYQTNIYIFLSFHVFLNLFSGMLPKIWESSVEGWEGDDQSYFKEMHLESRAE